MISILGIKVIKGKGEREKGVCRAISEKPDTATKINKNR